MSQTTARKFDHFLGRVYLRGLAVLCFLVFAAAMAFGLWICASGHIEGYFVIAFGLFFLWLGARSWRSRAGIAEVFESESANSRHQFLNSKQDRY